MNQEDEKSEVRVEDRRYFDKEGNPIHEEKAQPSEDPVSAPASEQKQKEEPRIPPPKIDFASLVFLYVHSALMYLGEVEDPGGQKAIENLNAAQQAIDTLELLQEKTRGNLTSQEEEYLEGALFDLRMRFVQKARKS